jgi:hypothetical protein
VSTDDAGPTPLFAVPSGGTDSGDPFKSALSQNSNLQAARNAKEDEFYTQLADIERELRLYRPHFAGKTVYLNCDDPRDSNFFRYFSLNFEHLGLKRLIATSFDGGINGEAVSCDYDAQLDGTATPDLAGKGVQPLRGSGDFRSPECIALLKQADIVVTNPPFSLFREYLTQLVDHEKQFIILGNQNAITYSEVFPLIKEGKVWLGNHSGDMKFQVPGHYAARKTRYWVDESGQKWRSLGNACWFTNLHHPKRHTSPDWSKTYKPSDFPKYVNYDAIEVARTADIPIDYPGAMGVPITFLSKWNPDEFDILGNSGTLSRPLAEVAPGQTGSGRFYIKNPDGSYRRLYDRIVIRRRHDNSAARREDAA